jgi:hypothetical protein
MNEMGQKYGSETVYRYTATLPVRYTYCTSAQLVEWSNGLMARAGSRAFYRPSGAVSCIGMQEGNLATYAEQKTMFR